MKNKMKSPIFVLQIKAKLYKEDAKAIQEALDHSYTAGYEKGYNDGRFCPITLTRNEGE